MTILRECNQCGNSLTKRWQTKFCSSECSATYNNLHHKTGRFKHGMFTKKLCKECGNETKNRKYCSSECANKGRKKEWEQKLQTGKITYSYTNGQVRKWLLNNREHKCESCHLTDWLDKPINLTMEHKDGNACNNIPENLMLLCWNCHSMTLTFGRKNINGTRHYRK